MICIIDYGAGNIHSVKNALKYVGAECMLSANPEDILTADKVLLPGVGAFGDAMHALENAGLVNTVREVVSSGKPFLGICLGMQLLFEESEESPGVPGLGIYKGKIKRFSPDMGLKVPQIGWNDISVKKPDSIFAPADGRHVYFVHSFYLEAENPAIVAATAVYGREFHAAVADANVSACQFHPEKSGEAGLKILKKWALEG